MEVITLPTENYCINVLQILKSYSSSKSPWQHIYNSALLPCDHWQLQLVITKLSRALLHCLVLFSSKIC